MEAEYKKVPIEELEKSLDADEKEPTKYGYGKRHVQALLCFMCIALGYIARGHMGVTIVAMTMVKQEDKPVGVAEAANVLVNTTIVLPTANAESNVKNLTAIKHIHENVIPVNETDFWNTYKIYNWPKSIQETILGSFFLGYSIMMFPMGLVCQRWGGKIPLQAAMFVNGAVSLLTPWCVAWGDWKSLSALRVLQGLSQAGLYPAVNTILANWIPISERGSIISYVFSASAIGAVIGFQAAGILAFSRFGWPSTFWVAGVASFIGFLIITIFGVATPKEHKSITEAEKLFIIGNSGHSTETKAKIPWKSVLKSMPVWATIATHTGYAICYVFFFIQVPTYMFAVLKFNIRSSGILSSLPYLSSCFSAVVFGYMSDYLTNKKILSHKAARKIFNSIGSIVPALCLIFVSFTTNTSFAVTCFVLFLTAKAAIHTAWMINYMDLSPNYSGALMATGNTIANVFVLVLPVIISNIILDVTNQYQWRITMCLMAAIVIGANTIFVVFMSADIQPWNNGIKDTIEKEPEVVKLES